MPEFQDSNITNSQNEDVTSNMNESENMTVAHVQMKGIINL